MGCVARNGFNVLHCCMLLIYKSYLKRPATVPPLQKLKKLAMALYAVRTSKVDLIVQRQEDCAVYLMVNFNGYPESSSNMLEYLLKRISLHSLRGVLPRRHKEAAPPTRRIFPHSNNQLLVPAISRILHTLVNAATGLHRT